MQNDAGEFVDLYVPRKCSASNRIIGAKDHASIQMNVAEVDKVTGRFNGQFKTYAICGAIRRMGESDDSILRLAKNDGIVSNHQQDGQSTRLEVRKTQVQMLLQILCNDATLDKSQLLSPQFLICKMGMIITLTSQV
uniref:Small ribosomal subunit protein eS21 n=1 Tax=Vombatus ursinus TaxID=29139 RepID=A0A4X2LGZ0_VOMUR